MGFDVRGKLLSWKRGEGTENIQRTNEHDEGHSKQQREETSRVFFQKKKTKKHHALEIGDDRARLSMDNYLTSIA